MSVSQHPIALRLKRQVGEGTLLLATVMGLPLVDGIFPALILAGAVADPLGVLEVGLLVFGGSATLAVVLAEMTGSRRAHVTAILAVGAVLLPVAALEAALAPTIRAVIDLGVFHRFAALVILAVAAKTASATVGEYLPSPGVVVGFGLLASLDPSALDNVSIQVVSDPTIVARGVAAAGVGVAFALLVAVAAPWLRGNVDVDRFRFGSAVALGVLALSVLEVPIVPSEAPVALAVLGVTAVLAFDPATSNDQRPVDDTSTTATDGGAVDEPGTESPASLDAARRSEADPGGTPGLSDGDRAPWL